MAEDMLIWW